jgi:hypothetical protein
MKIAARPITEVPSETPRTGLPNHARLPTIAQSPWVAAALGAVILRPYYPVSNLYRMVDDATGLQADFMPAIHGVRSFEGLRARAVKHSPHGCTLLVASLEDIIASKRAAGRDRDLAVLPVLERTLQALASTGTPPAPKKRSSPRRCGS